MADHTCIISHKEPRGSDQQRCGSKQIKAETLWVDEEIFGGLTISDWQRNLPGDAEWH